MKCYFFFIFFLFFLIFLSFFRNVTSNATMIIPTKTFTIYKNSSEGFFFNSPNGYILGCFSIVFLLIYSIQYLVFAYWRTVRREKIFVQVFLPRNHKKSIVLHLVFLWICELYWIVRSQEEKIMKKEEGNVISFLFMLEWTISIMVSVVIMTIGCFHKRLFLFLFHIPLIFTLYFFVTLILSHAIDQNYNASLLLYIFCVLISIYQMYEIPGTFQIYKEKFEPQKNKVFSEKEVKSVLIEKNIEDDEEEDKREMLQDHKSKNT